MLIGAKEDPDSIGAGSTYMQKYGRFFIIVSLPIGAILLLGAWLFYVDVKKTEARNRAG